MRIKTLLCSVSVGAALVYAPSADARGWHGGGGFMMMRGPVFFRPAAMPVYYQPTYYVQAAPRPYCGWYYGQLACWNGQEWHYANINWQGYNQYYNPPAAPAYNSGYQTASGAPSWRNDLGNMAGAAGVGAVGGALANRALNGVESRAVAKGAETVAERGAERVAVARTVGTAAVAAEEAEGAELFWTFVRTVFLIVK